MGILGWSVDAEAKAADADDAHIENTDLIYMDWPYTEMLQYL